MNKIIEERQSLNNSYANSSKNNSRHVTNENTPRNTKQGKQLNIKRIQQHDSDKFMDFLNNNQYVKKMTNAEKQKSTAKQPALTINNTLKFNKDMDSVYSHFETNMIRQRVLSPKYTNFNNMDPEDLNNKTNSVQDDTDEFQEEAPDEQLVQEEIFNNLIDDFSDKIQTQLERDLLKQISECQARIFVQDYHLDGKTKDIQDLQEQKQQLQIKVDEYQKQQQQHQQIVSRHESKIKKLEKYIKEQDELYKTLKHLLSLNIKELEQAAIQKAKKLIKIPEEQENEDNKKRPQSSIPQTSNGQNQLQAQGSGGKQKSSKNSSMANSQQPKNIVRPQTAAIRKSSTLVAKD